MRLWKRCTIRQRARRCAEKIASAIDAPAMRDHAGRTLIRLNNIANGIRPFDTTAGQVGAVLVWPVALVRYGNVRDRAAVKRVIPILRTG